MRRREVVEKATTRLDVVDINGLATGLGALLVLGVTVLVELEAAVAILVGAEGVGLVDLGGVGKLAVGLPVDGESRWLVGLLLTGWRAEGGKEKRTENGPRRQST